MTTTKTPLGTSDAGPLPAIGPPLTKEQAMADTIRALKECYPDRWERVWEALGKKSASDKLVAELASKSAANPSLGALIGGIIGAAVGGAGKLR